MIRKHAYYALCTILTFASTICFLWEPSGSSHSFHSTFTFGLFIKENASKRNAKSCTANPRCCFFRQCESWWCFLWEGRQGPPGRWREPIPGWLLNPTNKSYFLLKESVRLNLGCTPPKTNMDTQKWWFGKGASFWIWPFLGIYAEFLGVVFVCQPFSSGTFARFRSFSLNSLTH